MTENHSEILILLAATLVKGPIHHLEHYPRREQKKRTCVLRDKTVYIVPHPGGCKNHAIADRTLPVRERRTMVYEPTQSSRLVEGTSVDKTRRSTPAYCRRSNGRSREGEARSCAWARTRRLVEIETKSADGVARPRHRARRRRLAARPGNRDLWTRSSGKTTLTLHVIAEAQKKGGVCAFVDAEHALDPVYARKLGVNLNDLPRFPSPTLASRRLKSPTPWCVRAQSTCWSSTRSRR